MASAIADAFARAPACDRRGVRRAAASMIALAALGALASCGDDGASAPADARVVVDAPPAATAATRSAAWTMGPGDGAPRARSAAPAQA
jgi:hypothetical protein